MKSGMKLTKSQKRFVIPIAVLMAFVIGTQLFALVTEDIQLSPDSQYPTSTSWSTQNVLFGRADGSPLVPYGAHIAAENPTYALIVHFSFIKYVAAVDCHNNRILDQTGDWGETDLTLPVPTDCIQSTVPVKFIAMQAGANYYIASAHMPSFQYNTPTPTPTSTPTPSVTPTPIPDQCSPVTKTECVSNSKFRDCDDWNQDGALEWKTFNCPSGTECSGDKCMTSTPSPTPNPTSTPKPEPTVTPKPSANPTYNPTYNPTQTPVSGFGGSVGGTGSSTQPMLTTCANFWEDPQNSCQINYLWVGIAILAVGLGYSLINKPQQGNQGGIYW